MSYKFSKFFFNSILNVLIKTINKINIRSNFWLQRYFLQFFIKDNVIYILDNKDKDGKNLKKSNHIFYSNLESKLHLQCFLKCGVLKVKYVVHLETLKIRGP